MRSQALSCIIAVLLVLTASSCSHSSEDSSPNRDRLTPERIEQIGAAYGRIVETCDRKKHVPILGRQRASRALSVLTSEYRRVPTKPFHLDDSGGEETLQHLLEGVVILTFDTDCRSLARLAKGKLDRELNTRSR